MTIWVKFKADKCPPELKIYVEYENFNFLERVTVLR